MVVGYYFLELAVAHERLNVLVLSIAVVDDFLNILTVLHAYFLAIFLIGHHVTANLRALSSSEKERLGNFFMGLQVYQVFVRVHISTS